MRPTCILPFCALALAGVVFALSTCSVKVEAQNVEGQIIAAEYGEWKVPSTGIGFSFDPASCQVSGGGKNFPAFSNATPIKVVDVNPSLTEVSNVTVYAHIDSSSCSVSLGGLSNGHTSFYLTSGTGGLQEALNNARIRGGGPNTIILNAEWYELVAPGNTATVIGTVTGGSGLGLVDITTAPYTYYTWSGGSFIATITGVLSTGQAGGSLSGSYPNPGLSSTVAIPSGATATTQALGDNSARIATDAFVLGNLPGVPVGSVFGRTGVIVPLSGDYAVSQVTGAAPLASPAFTGAPTAPTQTAGDYSTKLATDAFVLGNLPGVSVGSVFGRTGAIVPVSGDYAVSQVTGAAPLVSPAFTGAPTAPTQTAGDNSTKLATDAFVLANSGGSPSGAAGGSLSGSYPNPGLASGAAIVPAPLASQFVFQPNGTTLQLNNLLASPFNKVVYADGVNGTGIGQASVAWLTATSYPWCRAVSRSGSNFINVSESGDSVTTPGTSSTVWYPISNAATPTQLDCAFYTAASQINGTQGASVVLGAGTYTTGVGLTEPTVTTPGNPSVSIYGQGPSETVIKQVVQKTDGYPTLYQPDTTIQYAFATFVWKGFTVNANFLANSVAGIYAASSFVIEDVIFQNPADFNDHVVEFGDAATTPYGWVFQPILRNVTINNNHGAGGGAQITASVSAGVPSFTIVSGGSGYNQWGSDTYATLLGYSNFGRACSSTGTTSLTVVSGVITGITSTATGCVAPLYVMVYGGQNINYGFKFSNASDSEDITALLTATGTLGGLYLSNISDQLQITKYHPDNIPIGILSNGAGDTFYSLQCDTIRQACASIAGAGVMTFINPIFEWSDNNSPGSVDWYFPSVVGQPGYSEPLAVNIYSEVCGNQASYPGYAHFATAQGVVDSIVGSDSGSLPNYVHDTGVVYCNLMAGNATPSPTVVSPTLVGSTIGMSNGVSSNDWNFGLGSLFTGTTPQTMTLWQTGVTSGSNQGVYNWNFANTTVATNSANYSSPSMSLLASYWNGSATSTDAWTLRNVLGSGTNPASTLGWTHSGSSGTASMVLPNPTTATTQSTGDNSTKIATDAFVLANQGAGALVSASTIGQAPISIGAGTTYMPVTLTASNLSYGAICNGSNHPASGYYGTLTALQVKYSFATSLTNQMDWLGTQAAVNAFGATGGLVRIVTGTCLFDQPLILPLAVDSNAPNGGNGLYIKGDGKGSTFISPMADFGSGSAVISCGPISASHANPIGRYSNNGCYGGLIDLTVTMPNSQINTFGVPPTINGTPVAMDGLYMGSAEMLTRVTVFGFYNGVNVVGDHVAYTDISSIHNYCGMYMAPQNISLYGDISLIGHDDFGGNAMAGICISPDAYLSVEQAGEAYVGHEPYGIIKWAGTPSFAGVNVFLAASHFAKVQAESIGNAAIWDDNYTQPGGGFASPAQGGTIYDTWIEGFYSSYQSTYHVTAGGRDMLSYISAYNIDGLYLQAEQGAFLTYSGGDNPASLVSGIYETSGGYENGGLTLQADFDTILPIYASLPFAYVQPFDLASDYIKFVNPGKWSGGCYAIAGPLTVTAGQVLTGSNSSSVAVASGTTPILGVAMQTMTAGSGAHPCIVFADQGNAIPTLISGVTSTQQNQAIVAGAGGAGVPYVPAQGGYVIGTLINPLTSTNGLLKLSLGSYNSPTKLGGAAFTVSGCGTPTATANSFTGHFAAGSATCAPVITTNQNFANGYVCTAQDATHPADVFTQASSTSTTATFNSTTLTSGDTIYVNCDPIK